MKVTVKVTPGSKVEKITKKEDGSFEIKVKARAQESKANLAVIAVLAKYFKVPKSYIQIKTGHKGKNKIIEISS